MLTIGSVVLLKGGEQKLMIIGRKPVLEKNNDEKVYMDYVGCVYPIGILEDEVYYFNEDDIKEVIFEGYQGEEETEVRHFIEEWEQLTPIRKGKVNSELLIE